LSLDNEQRAEFADLLVGSLAAEDAEEVHQAWATEVERRVAEIRSGKAKMIDGDEAIAMARRGEASSGAIVK
jgi:hypothetical protein